MMSQHNVDNAVCKYECKSEAAFDAALSMAKQAARVLQDLGHSYCVEHDFNQWHKEGTVWLTQAETV